MSNNKTIMELLPLIPMFPLIGMIINGLIGKFLPKKLVHLIAITALLASFTTVVIVVSKLAGLPEESRSVSVELFKWITVGNFNISFSFTLDPLSSVMLLVITGIGGLIHVYSVGYMHGDKSYSRFFTYLNLFVFAMLLLVLGSNMLIMFIGWEGVGLASYLLIGFWFEDSANAAAGMKAFITNRIGDFGFLIGMFILILTIGSLDFNSIKLGIDSGAITTTIATAATMLFFVGAMGKSAQIPLYVWLPDAMAGPTPVSALIHAATMVTAGVYMIVRLNFLFILAPGTMTFIALIGALTAFFAASIGLVQNDIKKVLAYSTVSQLGYMFLGVGVGAFGGGILHLVTHAFFKATLFLGAGSVILGMHHDQDMRNMGGLKKRMPLTHLAMLIATIAITGTLPLSGFISKDEILWKSFATKNTVIPGIQYLFWGLGVAAAIMTSFYMWRLYYLTFQSGKTRHKDHHVVEHIKESPKSMTWVLLILSFFSIVIGWIGLPHLFYHGKGIFNSFHRWLEPVVRVSEAKISEHVIHHNIPLEVGLMVFTSVLILGSWFWARKWYRKEVSINTKIWAEALKPIHKLLYNKYFVDELYYWLIDKLILQFSHKVLWKTIDYIIIDNVIINGLVAGGSKTLGFILGLFQTGKLQFYAFVMVATFFFIFYFMTL